MPVKKHIVFVFMAIALYQPAGAFLSLHPLVKTAWAGETSDMPEKPPVHTGELKPTELHPEPEGVIAPERPPVEQQQQPVEAPKKPEEQKGIVDILHGGISRGILATAGWLDSFFYDERYKAEENRSRVMLRYDAFLEDRAVPARKPSVDVRLAFPQLERRTTFVIRGEPATTPEGAAIPQAAAVEGAAPTEDGKLTAEIHYIARSTVKESFIIKTGAQFSLGLPVLIFAPRYRLLIPLQPWDLRFTQEVVWRSDTRWHTDTRLDIERQLTPGLFFRTSADGIWAEGVDGYSYTLSFLLRQPLDPKRALEYEWINFFHTRPVHDLEAFIFWARYRQSIWRNWIFFEMAPQCRFPRDREFRAVPGMLFRIEMVFGYL